MVMTVNSVFYKTLAPGASSGRAIVFGLSILGSGCAVNLNDVDADADAVATGGRQGMTATVVSASSKLSFEERGLLRDSRRLFHDTVGGKQLRGNDRLLDGDLRIYRWGTDKEKPLASYSWDENQGERWHVARGNCQGEERDSCGRHGIRPIDEFYLAEKVTLTLIDSVGSGGKEIEYGRPVPVK